MILGPLICRGKDIRHLGHVRLVNFSELKIRGRKKKRKKKKITVKPKSADNYVERPIKSSTRGNYRTQNFLASTETCRHDSSDVRLCQAKLSDFAPITARRNVIHKTENTKRRQKRTEPWPQGISIQNFVPIGPAVSEICSRTDRQTHRRTDRPVDHNTPHPCRREVVITPLCGEKIPLPCPLLFMCNISSLCPTC